MTIRRFLALAGFGNCPHHAYQRTRIRVVGIVHNRKSSGEVERFAAHRRRLRRLEERLRSALARISKARRHRSGRKRVHQVVPAAHRQCSRRLTQRCLQPKRYLTQLRGLDLGGRHIGFVLDAKRNRAARDACRAS